MVKAQVDTGKYAALTRAADLNGGSMVRASLTLGEQPNEHVGAVVVFGESRIDAERRALRLAAGWNAMEGKPLLETREVLATAYLGPNKGASMLSHSVEVGASGSVIRALCDRVSPLSIADAGAQDITADPTCKTCLARRKKWKPA